MPSLLYVYGFAERAPERQARRLDGPGVEEDLRVEWLGPHDVDPVSWPCQAIVSSVPAREYDEVPLAAHVQDPAWLVPRAERHVRVLVRLMGRRGVVPCRFGTVYRDRGGVAGFIDRHRGPLRAALRRVRGAAEWAVKTYVSAPRVQEASAGGAGASPGTDYFQGLLRRRADLREAEAYADASAEGIRRRLLEFASRVVDLPSRDGGLSPGRHIHMNLACLVPATETRRFLELFARVAKREIRRGIEVVFSGPWPPYSFVADLFPAQESDLERVP